MKKESKKIYLIEGNCKTCHKPFCQKCGEKMTRVDEHTYIFTCKCVPKNITLSIG